MSSIIAFFYLIIVGSVSSIQHDIPEFIRTEPQCISAFVITDSGVIMIDSPWDSNQLQPLLDSIYTRHGQEVKLCVATHAHEDRTGGLKYYSSKGILTYTSTATDEICKQRGENRAEFTFSKDTIFNCGHTEFQTFYPGHGHAPDNITIWFGKEKVLYGGCFIKSTEANDLGNLADADIPAWLISIEQLKRKFNTPKYVIPGHQSWLNSNSIEHTFNLIKEKLKQ